MFYVSFVSLPALELRFKDFRAPFGHINFKIVHFRHFWSLERASIHHRGKNFISQFQKSQKQKNSQCTK